MMLKYLIAATMHGTMVRVSERVRDEVQMAAQSCRLCVLPPSRLLVSSSKPQAARDEDDKLLASGSKIWKSCANAAERRRRRAGGRERGYTKVVRYWGMIVVKL